MKFSWGSEDIKGVTDHISSVDTTLSREINALKAQLEALRVTVAGNKATLDPVEKSRLDELEMRLAKLWALLTETSNAGRPKLSSFGRSVRGRLRN